MVATTKLVTSLTSLKDKVHGETKKEVKAIANSALEAVQVWALALHEINQKRRGDMKYDLHVSYRALCNPPKEEADELFGTNLNERVRELNEVRRMGKQVTEPYSYQSKGSNYRKPFLGGRRFQQHSYNKSYGGRNRQDFKKSTNFGKYKNKPQNGGVSKK